MANTRDIRLRIKGVKSTRQITRAMQMVATSKMKKAQDAAKSGRPYAMLLADFSLPDKPRYSDIKAIIEFLLRAYGDDQIDTIEVLHTGFINTLRQEPELVRLFPLNDLDEMSQKLHERFGVNDHDVPKDKREILIENRDEVLAELGTLYLKQQIHQMVMESQASEHSARMVAMKTATDNAGNLINDLTLQYNRARQAAITQEILEISAATLSN